MTMLNSPLWVKQEVEVKSGTTWNVFKLEVRDNDDETVDTNPELAPAASVNLDGKVVEVVDAVEVTP